MKKFVSVLVISAVLSSSAYAFSDVAPDSWYCDSIEYVVERELFNGTSETTFSPQGTMTRGMFVTALGRLAGVNPYGSGTIIKSGVNMRSGPSTSTEIVGILDQNAVVDILGLSDGWYQIKFGKLAGYVRSDLMEPCESGFTDVRRDAYYKAYVMWACANNIASASSGVFSPEAEITRGEICSMLYNYARYTHLDITPKYEETHFSDHDAISGHHVQAVYAMKRLGVINGRGDDQFASGESATRAEVSTIFMRFLENAKYRFGTPVPESGAVSDNYFNDACFIGHSMVVGMSGYFNLENADFFSVNGISAAGMLSYDGFTLGGDKKTGTLSDALSESSYGKVYIMLGTNELAAEEEHRLSYYNSMCAIVDLVRSRQPDAVIYILANPPVSSERSETSTSFNRENVLAFNEQLIRVAENKQTYYLDIYSLLADENGYLPKDSCISDGIHILEPEYHSLKSYLRTHTIAAHKAY